MNQSQWYQDITESIHAHDAETNIAPETLAFLNMCWACWKAMVVVPQNAILF